jgi:hypothetical protein
LTPNRLFSTTEAEPSAVKDDADADERKLRAQAQELEMDKSNVAQQYPPVPGYWVHKDLTAIHCERVPTRFMVQRLQALLRSTLCGRGDCVGDCSSLSQATVTRVDRVENTILWQNYAHRKAMMQQLLHGSCPPAVSVPLHEVIDADVNEVYLFSGMHPDQASIIVEHGYDERASGIHGL